MPRQHYSCDQCRKSKRACDAPQPELSGRVLHGAAETGKRCSYCRRTGKICTMNWAWQQIHVALALQAPPPLLPPPPPPCEPPPSLKPQMQHSLDVGFDCAPNRVSDFGFGQVIPEYDLASLLVAGAPPAISGAGDLFDNPAIPPEIGYAVPNLSPPPPPPDQAAYFAAVNPFSPVLPPLTYYAPDITPDTFDFTSIDSTPTYNPSPSSLRNQRSDSLASDRSSIKRRRRRYTQSTEDTRLTPASSSMSLSHFSMDQTMMARSASTSISASLLQIYHDVLEHSFSCWVTEATCPYMGTQARDDGLRLVEWGPNWSNRVFQRTVKLDRAARARGLVSLTPAQDRVAARALHSSIMAFATQWAQGSRRQRQRYGAAEDDDGDDLEQQTMEEFDRTLQRHFWAQAEAALNSAAGLESYKVACAELIFSLAQRPWTDEPIQPSSPWAWDPGSSNTNSGGCGGCGCGGGCGGDNSSSSSSSNNNSSSNKLDAFDTRSLMNEINRVIERDGPPVYVERAVRRMHALKCRFESAAQEWVGGQRSQQQGQHQQHGQQGLGQEDERTVGLLYWLAIMFDTVSSGMNERPVSVTDRDSQHDLAAPQEQLDSWKVDLFIKDDVACPRVRIAWPCSYQDAAEAVTRSAPVKVLLYRHLAQLQALLLQRGQRGASVEEAVANATMLYRYWNVTHGAFFRDLVRNYADVAARIRSWFVCISSHWHLAVLMLADLIEFADAGDRGLPAAAAVRHATRLVATMRRSSVRELADLARVSTPPGDSPDNVLQLPEFHHAVNEGTILTEPWTIILIRAFSRAAVLSLAETQSYRRYGLATTSAPHNASFGYGGAGADAGGGRGEDGMSRVKDCVRALFYLGRKSDMARWVADMLDEAMAGLRAANVAV